MGRIGDGKRTSYCIFFSREAQSVSRGVPRGSMLSSEKRPIHFNPAMMRSFSSLSANLVFELMAQIKSLRKCQ